MSSLPQYQPVENASDLDRMEGLIEFLSAYIEYYHGGSVKLVSFDGHILEVEMGGSCLGCPLSPNTLHGWIEGTVRQFFPDIESVQSRAAVKG